MKSSSSLNKQNRTVEIQQILPPANKPTFLDVAWDLLSLFVLAGLLALVMYLGNVFLSVLRIVLGLVFVLFAPGYALQEALFPRRADQDGVARLAISIGASIAILPPVALILNWMPWGLRAWPTFLSLVIIMAVFSGVAFIRRRFLPSQAGSAPALNLNFKRWWAAQEVGNRRLLALVGISLGIAFLSVLALIFLPKSGDRFTEFYMLGSSGLSQDYPREAFEGEPVEIILGITNQEKVTSVYYVLVESGDQLLTQIGPIFLDDGATWSQQVEFILPAAGENQAILFVLERDGQLTPYRTLQLWVNVKSKTIP